MPKIGDFVPKKPFEEEAERRVAERRQELKLYLAPFSDDELVQLMTDYAAQTWQEGYEEGTAEGYDDGYAAAENDAS